MKNFFKKIAENFNVSKANRPGWFIDAKWVFSLAFILVFSTCLTSYNVMQVTSRERAVETLTGIIEKSLDTAEDGLLGKIENYKQKLAKKEGSQISDNTDEEKDTIGKALSFFFPEQDIMDKPATELKELFLKKLATPIYEEGTSVVFSVLKDINYTSPIDKALKKVPIYSDETHDKLMTWFVTTLIISMILLVGAVYFSRGWGKIFVPGLIIALASGPGFFGYGYSRKFLKDVIPNVTAESGNFFINVFVVGIVQTLEKYTKEIVVFQATWFWIGIALIITAIAGKIFITYRKKTTS